MLVNHFLISILKEKRNRVHLLLKKNRKLLNHKKNNKKNKRKNKHQSHNQNKLPNQNQNSNKNQNLQKSLQMKNQKLRPQMHFNENKLDNHFQD